MARLIPRKQIEEQQNISGSLIIGEDLLVGGNVIITGSLQSDSNFFLGDNLTDRGEITGSVFLTGSFIVDGLFELGEQTLFSGTSSFSNESFDTERYAGILAKDFGANVPTLYVSSTDGDDSNDGRSIQYPLRTIKRAAQLANPGYDGRYGFDTGSVFNGYVIKVQAGTYLEDNPVILPSNTTVWGAGLRITKINAKNPEQDLFWVNSGCYIAEVTMGGLRLWPDQINPERGFGVAFQPGAFITTSPYVQNCSQISNQENSFTELYEDIPPGGGGLHVNGDVVDPDSPLASMVLDAYTQISPNGVGCLVNGRGFIQLVSFFTNFSYYAIRVNNGGHATLNNSNISFGLFGMYASGSRFISGSTGGNIDARDKARASYSIIVDTLNKGLEDGLPDVTVLNTDAGIKVTDELQYFPSEDSTPEAAAEVLADFNLVSAIVENGTSNYPTLLARSSTKGYGFDSPYNILGAPQTTQSLSASDADIAQISSSFGTILGIFADGTGSYNFTSSATPGIKVTEFSTTAASQTAPDFITGSVSSSFGTVLNILQNGLSVTGNVKSNNSASVAVTLDENTPFTTGISSSLVVQNSVSASFSIVYNILANGTGSTILDIPQNHQREYSVRKSNDNTKYVFAITGSGEVENATLTLFRGETYKLFVSAGLGPDAEPFFIRGTQTSGFDKEDILNYNFGTINNGDSNGTITFNVPYNAPNTLYYISQDTPSFTGVFNIVNNSLTPKELIESTLTYPATIQSSSIASEDVDKINGYDLLNENLDFIKDETIEFVSSSWSNFSYDESVCRRDIGFIVNGVLKDLLYGGNEESIRSGLFYYQYPSEATTTQLGPTLTAIKYVSEMASILLQNKEFVEPNMDRDSAASAIFSNREFIQNEVIAYISSSWSEFEYNEASCSRDVGFILDAVTTDLRYEGNARAVEAGQYYYLYPSQATGNQLSQTSDGIRYAAGLAQNIILNRTFTEAAASTQAAYTNLRNNKQLIQNETIEFVNVAYPTLEYNQEKCRRDVGYIVDAVATDLLYSANERSVIAGRFYYDYPSIATTTQRRETAGGIQYAKIISEFIVKNLILDTPRIVTNDERLIRVTSQTNVTSSVSGTDVESANISSSFAIIEGIIKRGSSAIPSLVAQNTDLNWSITNPLNVSTTNQITNSFVNPSEIQTIQNNWGIITSIIADGTAATPTFTSSVDSLIKVTDGVQTIGSSVSNSITESISSSFSSIINIIENGTGSFTPTTATYNPANGDFVMTIPNHTLNTSNFLYLRPESFVFTCDMDGNKTEHALPSIGQPAYNNRLAVKSVTDNTVTIDVGTSGPNVEFTPTTASYDPSTGDFVMTVTSHSLSVGEGIILDPQSFAFTCDMDNDQSVKSYPRLGIDPYAGRSMKITSITDTTMTVNVGASGPNKYFTPTNVDYNALTGDMILTVSESFGLGIGRSVVLENESFAFTCDQDGNTTTHSYPRSGSDPYAEQSIVITSVGKSLHTVIDAPYDASNGDVTITISNHNFTNGDYIKLSDNSLTYTCILDGNTTQKSYPRTGIDYPSGRWLEISNVTTNTFDINIGSSPYTAAHTFVSATPNGLERQDGTFTINVGDAGSASGSIHTFVSSSIDAVKHLPQSVHTFVSASAGAIKHLPQSAHTFVRTTTNSVSKLPTLVNNASDNIKVTSTAFVSGNGGDNSISSSFSSSIQSIVDIITNGLSSLQPLTSSLENNIKVGSVEQYISASASGSLDSEYNNGSIISLTGDGSDFFKKEVTINGVRIVVAGDVGGQTAVPDAFTEKVARMFELFTDPSGSGINETFQRNLIKTLSGDSGTYHAGLPTIQRVARGAGSDYTPNFLDDAGILYWNLTNLFDTHVQNDMVWYLNSTGAVSGSGDNDAQEVIEHVFHTLHMHGLPADDIKLYSYLAPDWQTGDLYLAMEEAYDAGLWDSAGYGGNAWKTDSDAFEVAAKEYIYLLNFSMFEYTDLWEGGSLSPEWDDSMRTQAGILANNPLGYAFHNTYISPTISKPSLATIRSIFQDGDLGDPTIAGESGYVVQYISASASGSLEDISAISSSISLVTRIIERGESAVVAKTPYTTPLSSSSVLAAYEILRQNIDFIQEETIQYLSSSWSTFDYDESKCRRDVGLIISGAAEDLIWNSNSASIVNGQFYYEYPSQATGSQLAQTLDGINYASRLAQKLIQNVEFQQLTGSALSASILISDNRAFIQDETIQYLSSSWSDFVYDDVKCRRDVGYILDAAITDLKYGGNERSRVAGEYYFLFPSDATGSQLIQTTDGINYASRLAQKIAVGETFTSADSEKVEASRLLKANADLIANEVVEYVSSSWSGVQYDETKCKRDVKYILDAVRTDLVYGGNERTSVAGDFYYRYPSAATVAGVPSSTQQLDPTITGINYANRLAGVIAKSLVLSNPSTSILTAAELIRENRSLIQDNTIEFVSDTYPKLRYDVARCRRDTGFIVDAVVTDLVYGGNERSITAGAFYYLFPSQATDSQETETINALNFARDLAKLIALGSKAIEDSFDNVSNIIQSGSSGIPTLVENTTAGIRVTDIEQITTSSVTLSDRTDVSASFSNVINIVLNGTGSIPTIVTNTTAGVKITDNTQITSSVNVGNFEKSKVGSGFDVVLDIIENGTGSIPTLVSNTTSSIKVTNSTQLFTTASIQTNLINNSISSFDIVLDIVANGSGSTPILVKNSNGLFKITDTTQYTISTSVSKSIVDYVSSSFNTIINILENGTGSLPTLVDNTLYNRKISSTEQYISSSYSGSLEDIEFISASISIVTNIIANGTGSAPTIEAYTSSISSSSTLAAYEILRENIDFIQNETIAYLSSSWSTASYDEDKCRRDIGLIISGAVEDLIWNADSASIVNGVFYFESASQATEAQLNQTLDGLFYASKLAQKLVQNIEFTSPSAQLNTAYDLLVNNKLFVQNEVIEYISSSWSTKEYDEVTCKRDVGYIIDAVATDLRYGGNERSVKAGEFYYLYPSAATGSQIRETVTGITHAKNLSDRILRGGVFTKVPHNRKEVRELIVSNKSFIQNEVIAYVSASWNGFEYVEETCKRDVGFILDAVSTDLVYGGNERSIEAGEFYYRYPSSATTSQLGPTLSGIRHAKGLTKEILSGVAFTTASLSAQTAYNLLLQNKPLIQAETIAYVSSSWSEFVYNDLSCSRDTGYIVDAVATDILYGGNERVREAGEYYYLYPSLATVVGDGDSAGQLGQTLDGIKYAKGLAQNIVNNVVLEYPTDSQLAGYELLFQNKRLLQSESIAFISSSWSGVDGFFYNQAKCARDVGYIVDAVATDLKYGGNERSSKAGEYYYLYPSLATVSGYATDEAQLDQTITGIRYAAGVSQKLLQNELLVTASQSVSSSYQLLRENKQFIQNETIQFIDAFYPYLRYNREKCRRDVGYIVDAVSTDLLYGGNERGIVAGDYYFRFPSKATTSEQVIETVAGVEYAKSVAKAVAQNIVLSAPQLATNLDANIKATETTQYTSSVSATTQQVSKVNSSFEIVTDTIQAGVESFTPTNATYNPANGEFVITIPNHKLKVSNFIYLRAESFVFTCTMDGNRTEHALPSIGQPAYNNKLEIQSVTQNTITVNVGKSGPNVEFNPTSASYNPATGEFVVTVGEHDLSVGEGIVLSTGSFAFTCDMDNNHSTKSYPRFGIDPFSVRSIPITAVTNDTLTFNVGASAPNKFFTPTNANYNALTGDMILTVGQHGLGVGRSVTLASASIAFTCDQDNNQTTHSYPRSGSDPYAGKSIEISSVGFTQHTVTNAPYDALSGIVILTINNHGFNNGDYVKISDNSLTYTCILDGNTIQKSYPRPGYDLPSGRWLEISNVTTNTFTIDIGSSSYVDSHTFITASINGLERQTGTFTINVGDAGSASGSIHTFVSASANAVRHLPQSVHTFVSASAGAIKHLPQSAHTFVRTTQNSVSTLPTIVSNVEELVKVNNIAQITSSISGGNNEVGLISSSFKLIRDIIYNGSTSIPDALASNYNYGFNNQIPTPLHITSITQSLGDGSQNVTSLTGSVSSSYGNVKNIVTNGTGSIPTLIENTSASLKVTDAEIYSSSFSGSITEIQKIGNLFGIVLNVIENGTSVIPTLLPNNTGSIKVTDTPQIISGSSADRLQSRLISASFGFVIDTLLNNGTSSIAYKAPNATPNTNPKITSAYNLLLDNTSFIQAETIAFMSSSWSGFEYTQSLCERDLGLIISGAAFDLLYGGNSASFVNGRFYFDYPSEATSSQLDQTITAIRYASGLAEKVVRNTVFTSITASQLEPISASWDLLKNNKGFIQSESIAYLSSSWSEFEYSQSTCVRDIGYIIDAVATDILYGGNERSIIAGDYYYRFPSTATTAQLEPTLTGIRHARGLSMNIVSGSTFQTASSQIDYAYDIIKDNKLFIQSESVAFVNAKFPHFIYDEVKCKRDLGYIIDAVITDLKWGGNERANKAGEFYYLFPSEATGVQVEETTAAVNYARLLTEEIMLNSLIAEPQPIQNTSSSIKVTDEPQYITGSEVGTSAEANLISQSISILERILENGTGSIELTLPLPTSSYSTPSNDVNVYYAYNLIKENLDFIKAETIAYMSSSWSTFPYNEASCSRDVGLIVSGAAEDMLYGSLSASLVNAKFYYEYPSQATGSQLQQTLDGIRYAKRITQKVLQNVEFVTSSAEVSASYHLLKDNLQFIQSESISFISSSWDGFLYSQSICMRDLGYIVDAVSTDLLYGGNERSVIAGDYYFRYPSTATTTQLDPTVTGIEYAGGLSSKLIQNEVFVTASLESLTIRESIRDNRPFIQDETLAYLTASWSTFDYDKVKCRRDVGYIVDAVATDLLYGGNERSVTAGKFYYLYPSLATVSGTTNGQLEETLDGIRYASGVAQKVVQNIEFVTASAEVSASFDLLRKNKPFIQAEAIAYVSSSWSGVYYNEASCSRDVGFLVDAAATDLLYGGQQRSVVAGDFYYRFPSRATNAGVPSEQNQLDPTISGVRYAGRVASKVVQNPTYLIPSASVAVANDLLINNKRFIQRETIAFLSSSWSTLEYNEASCSRDVGFIIDAVRTDLVYGGNERSIEAGSYYYRIPSVAIQPSYTDNGKVGQKIQTVDGINFAKGVAEKVVNKTQLVFPGTRTREAAARLIAAKEELKQRAIGYTNGAFPYLVYNEASCSRDTGLIVDAVVTDLVYGGNERAIAAASSYYNGVYGSAAAVINEQRTETLETNRYLRTRVEFIAQGAPLEDFGSLIVATGIDYSYNGSGVTFKALPPNQGGSGVPDPDFEITELGGGRIYFTSGNQDGDFRIGTGLSINQATGTLVGRTFSKSLFSLVTPFSLALEG